MTSRPAARYRVRLTFTVGGPAVSLFFKVSVEE